MISNGKAVSNIRGFKIYLHHVLLFVSLKKKLVLVQHLST